MPEEKQSTLSPEALAALFLLPMYGSRVDSTGKEGKSTAFDVMDTDRMGRDPKTNQLQNKGWLSSYYDPLTKGVAVDSYGYRGIKPPETSIGDKREIIRALQRAYPDAQKITGFKPGGALATIPLTPGVRAHSPQLLPELFGAPGTKLTDLW